jgi:hypothetical protein
VRTTTKNFVVFYEGQPVAHLQRTPGGLLLVPGTVTGNKLAELGLALENRQLPEGFTLEECRVAEQKEKKSQPNWKEVARRAREQRKHRREVEPRPGLRQ